MMTSGVAQGARKPVEPIDRGGYEIAPDLDITPFHDRLAMLELEYKSKWYQHHRDVSRFINPKRGFFEGYVPNWNAQIDHRLIIDGKPRRCVRTLAAGMQSGLSTPSRPWFALTVGDRDLEQYGPVKIWLEIVRDVLMRVFARCRIYQAFHQNYEELAQFGTGTFGLYEDYDTVLWARSYTCGEYVLANDPKGKVNAFGRKYWMTVANVVARYGWKNVSRKTQEAFKKGQRDTFLKINELCEPNDTKVDGRIGFEGMAKRQITWEDVDGQRPLEVKGYNEMPVIGARWDTVTTADTYGVSPAMYAIGDVKSTYRLKKDLLLGIAKKVDPPVIINSSVQGHPNMTPGGITRSSSQTQNPGAEAAYKVEIDVKDGAEFLQMFYRALDEEFYTDLFASMLSMDPGDKTAAEIAARHEEKLLLLGPVLERVFDEMFDPTIDRAFAVCLRAGLIPPPPREVMGRQLNARYISLLAQAQQMVSKNSTMQGLAFMGNIKPIYPEALDVVNPDELTREQMDALGISQRAIRTDEEIAQIRQERAKQQQALEQKQDLMAATVAAKNLAGSQVGGGNALEALTGAQPGLKQ